jgi:putative permease
MNKAILWIGSFAIILFGLWFFESIVTPFFISFLLAYAMHPIVYKISSRYKLNKTFVVALTVVCIISGVILLMALILPLLYEQIALLITQVPVYKTYIQNNIAPALSERMQYVSPEIVIKIHSALDSAINDALGAIVSGANNILKYTGAAISMIFTAILVPIILFYFLRDWPHKNVPFIELIPTTSRKYVSTTLSRIDNLLSAYILGQFNVCCIMALYYSIGLSFIGLNIGILFGIISGIAIIIPFVGFAISFCAVMIVGYFDFGASSHLLYISLLYFVGSVLEGSIITPKIVGDRIGLHPLWIIFAVLSGGHLFGIVGLLFAIPAAGICKIFLDLAVERYVANV